MLSHGQMVYEFDQASREPTQKGMARDRNDMCDLMIPILNMMILMQDISKMKDEFLRTWGHTKSHYRNTPCLAGCPCTFMEGKDGLSDQLSASEEQHLDQKESHLFSGFQLSPAPTADATPANPKSDSGRLFLDESYPPHKQALYQIDQVVDWVTENAHQFVHGFNTCFAESMHNKRLKYTDKRKSYMYFEVCECTHTHYVI